MHSEGLFNSIWHTAVTDDIKNHEKQRPLLRGSFPKEPVVINNAAGVKKKVRVRLRRILPFLWVHSNSGLLARLASGKGCTYFQPMAFLAAHTTYFRCLGWSGDQLHWS